AAARRLAVVIDQAATPFAAQLRRRQARQQRRVLHRNAGLIVVAVERPGLHLSARAPSGVQHPVERVQVVVALRPDRAAPRPQRPRRQRRRALREVVHSCSLMPSSATSHPRAAASARSGESSSSTGLVLLIWIKIFRRTPSGSKAAKVPSAPVWL